MKHWSEDFTGLMNECRFQALLSNTRPLRYLDNQDQAILNAAALQGDVMVLFSDGDWASSGKYTCMPGTVYRLDYAWKQRLEDKLAKEKASSIPRELIIPITKDDDRYCFEHPTMSHTVILCYANCLIGFAGIKYKEFPNEWFQGAGMFFNSLSGCMVDRYTVDSEDQIKPATPVFVRFIIRK